MYLQQYIVKTRYYQCRYNRECVQSIKIKGPHYILFDNIVYLDLHNILSLTVITQDLQ